jgi:hypothetical protein
MVLAHRLQPRMRAGFMQPGDNVSNGFADAGDFPQSAVADDLRERDGESAEAFGSPRIGFAPVGIAAAQRDLLPEFAQQTNDLRGFKRSHCLERTRELPGWLRARDPPRIRAALFDRKQMAEWGTSRSA